MTHSEASATIIHHISELEAALRHAHESMQPRLSKEVANIMNGHRRQLNWSGTVDNTFEEEMWIASPEWKVGVDGDQDYDLYCEFGGSLGVDGEECETWAGHFCGSFGTGIQFSLETKTLTKRGRVKLLKTEPVLVQELVARGFSCDPSTGEIVIPIPIDQCALSKAFENNDFDEALEPVSNALDRVSSALEVLDQLVAATRKLAK
jgi:hypothetical protein